MRELSRRQFLKSIAALTATGALDWKSSLPIHQGGLVRPSDLPVIGVDKAREKVKERRVIFVTGQQLTATRGLHEQPFAPYFVDPDAPSLVVPKFRGKHYYDKE